MACNDQITTQDLENAKDDATFLAEIANSKAGGESTGEPITTATNRFGEVTDTVQGRLSKLGVIYSDPIKDWSASLLVSQLEAHRYPAVNGEVYIPTAPLPFTTGATFDTSKWTLLNGYSESEINRIINESDYEDATELRLGSPSIGSIVGTDGYAYKGDNRAARYIIKTPEQAVADGDTLDDVVNIQISTGNWAIRLSTESEQVSYDSSNNELTSDNVQDAISELSAKNGSNDAEVAALQAADAVHDANIAALQAGQTGGVIVFQTYASLDAYTPANATEEVSSFKVANDPTSSLNGYYAWVSDTTYIKDASVVESVVEESNTSDGVSGKAVFDHTNLSIYSIPEFTLNLMANFTISEGYINTSGVITAGAGFRYTDLIRVQGGSIVYYAGTQTPTNVNQVSFYDVESNYISGVIGGSDGSIAAPSNAVYVVACALNASLPTSSVDATVMTSSPDSVIGHEERLSAIEVESVGAEVPYTNAFTELPLTYGYVNTSGNVIGEGTDTAWQHTTQLLTTLDNVTYSNTVTPTNVNQVSFYDIDLLYISGVIGGDNGTATPPANAVYVRFCRKSTASSASASFTGLQSAFVAINEKLNTADIVDNLTSTSNSVPLSANQGRILNEKIGGVGGGLNYNRDVNHIIWYGQSLSQGDWQTTIISDTQPYNTIMFNGGIRTWESTDPSPKSSLVPAIERAISGSVDGAPVKGETPASGSADFLVELIEQEDGFAYTDQQYQIMVSAPGFGGQSIDALSKGGAYYTRLLDDVTQAKALSLASNKTYWCPVVTWVQGETDTYNDMSQQTYYDKMVLLFNDLNTDIKAITGQSEDVQILLYQTGSFDYYYAEKYTYPDVSLAQLQITRDLPNVHMATPIYHLPKLNDVVHFTSVGSKWFGAYFGIAYKRLIIDQALYSGMYVKSHEVIGNDIYVKFHAEVYPLKFDTTNVVDRGVSKGFQIRNVGDRAQDSYLDIITDVQINKYDTVKISCSSSPAGKLLTYAMNGTGSTNPSSGNLRDSQSLVFDFKDSIGAGSTTPHSMYNWVPTFTQEL